MVLKKESKSFKILNTSSFYLFLNYMKDNDKFIEEKQLDKSAIFNFLKQTSEDRGDYLYQTLGEKGTKKIINSYRYYTNNILKNAYLDENSIERLFIIWLFFKPYECDNGDVFTLFCKFRTLISQFSNTTLSIERIAQRFLSEDERKYVKNAWKEDASFITSLAKKVENPDRQERISISLLSSLNLDDESFHRLFIFITSFVKRSHFFNLRVMFGLDKESMDRLRKTCIDLRRQQFNHWEDKVHVSHESRIYFYVYYINLLKHVSPNIFEDLKHALEHDTQIDIFSNDILWKILKFLINDDELKEFMIEQKVDVTANGGNLMYINYENALNLPQFIFKNDTSHHPTENNNENMLTTKEEKNELKIEEMADLSKLSDDEIMQLSLYDFYKLNKQNPEKAFRKIGRFFQSANHKGFNHVQIKKFIK